MANCIYCGKFSGIRDTHQECVDLDARGLTVAQIREKVLGSAREQTVIDQWTIARGVFLGLLLFSLLASAVYLVIWLLTPPR